jgi:hypothetical protein
MLIMSDDLPKIMNGNFLKHLHHFCISDDQGFSFLVHSTIKLCQEHAAQILRNVIKLYVSDRIKTDRLPDIDNFNCRDEIFKIHPFLWNFLFSSEWQLPKTSASFLYIRRPRFFFFGT